MTQEPLQVHRSAWIYAIAFWTFLFQVHGCARSKQNAERTTPAPVAVGPQYATTHVYVDPAQLDALVSSFIATFGGSTTKSVTVNVTPVSSSTEQQSVLTPVGSLSIFAFQTPVPFPFGQERTGYLVANMDRAILAARMTGAEVLVDPFQDPIGRDAIIQWPGGVKMQLYWHFNFSDKPPLETVPDNRVYLSRDEADNFVRDFVKFSGGKVLGDVKQADAGEIGRAGETYHRIQIGSLFGNVLVLVTDGHLPYPFGRELTGYEVKDVPATLARATASGAKIISSPYNSPDRITAVVEFPGGYLAEVHSLIPGAAHSSQD